jgi:glycosyltransferase involved in cell wall biosynthesis
VGVVLERPLRLRLVVPADVEVPTGGNYYDLSLAEALRGDGDEVLLARCEPSALLALLTEPWAGQTLVDGLLACSQPEAVASAEVAVLVHMPLGLMTGLSRERVDELDRLERLSLHAACAVIATSHWTSRYLGKHHLPVQVAVAPPGVDRAAVVTGSEPPLFVHVAALLPHKDQLTVVRALSRLGDLSWRARLAGSADRDREYASSVIAAVRASDLTGRVEIPGAMPRDAAWAGADLALLPSRAESFGMVVTEALARGIPAVVSQGGPAEALGITVDGQRPGVVIPPGHDRTLARVLRHWLTDEQYRRGLRRCALSRRTTLDGWATTAQKVRVALSGVTESA